MSKPDAPTPPDPIRTASAATGTNVSTAIANQFLSNQNQITPEGNLRYDVTGNYGWTDPTTNQTYNIPTFTSTQSLSPQAQAIKSQTDAAKMNLAGMANTQSERVSGLLSTPFSPNAGAPTAGDPNSILGVGKAATSFNAGGPIQNTFGDAGNITQSYGPTDDFSSDRQNVQDALMARINPQLQLQQNQLQQQLADQGIRYGSAAYNNAFTPFNQQSNDARFAAISQAGQEQQRMMDMAAQRAGFQNQAQQQAYEQAQGRGSFANQAQGQQFQQNAALGAFQNAGLAQQLQQAQSGFNAQQSARNQYMQEQYAQRNQPINEITSLMSGSQVQQPNWLNQPGAQIPTTDVAGLMNQNFQNQMGIYNAQNQQYNSLVGGALGLGAGVIKSDRRDKENIGRIGSVYTANPDPASPSGSAGHSDGPKIGTVFGKSELPVYQYSYKDDPASIRHVGPMAQDVEKVDPKAVKNIGGRKYLDQRRVMGGILRAG